jgi:hypothetical protein
MRHLRYALRTLIRHRSYSILGLLTLGLAIGANAVVFSIARGLLLRPLPIADADRVYFVAPAGMFSNSFPAYRDLRARNRTFADLAGYRIAPMALNTDTGSRRVWGYLATATISRCSVCGRPSDDSSPMPTMQRQVPRRLSS